MRLNEDFISSIHALQANLAAQTYMMCLGFLVIILFYFIFIIIIIIIISYNIVITMKVPPGSSAIPQYIFLFLDSRKLYFLDNALCSYR
jgi:hypothetical protein